MNYWFYAVCTLAGSGLWCVVLAWVGIKAGDDAKLMHGDLHQIMVWLLGALVVLGALFYFLVYRFFTEESRPVPR